MPTFSSQGSLREFQQVIQDIYGLPDDRLFSIHDLLSNQEKFTMRAIKGIRKGDTKKLATNLLIAFSWLMAVCNRLLIDIESEVTRRFPCACSYCGHAPCACKKIKQAKRAVIHKRIGLKSRSVLAIQEMFGAIYPPRNRTVVDAGVHLAEEMGEVSEAIHVFLGQHLQKQFRDVTDEVADFVSCVFGVANSASIDVAKELAKMFKNNCHVCNKAPCACKFSFVAAYKL